MDKERNRNIRKIYTPNPRNENNERKKERKTLVEWKKKKEKEKGKLSERKEERGSTNGYPTVGFGCREEDGHIYSGILEETRHKVERERDEKEGV